MIRIAVVEDHELLRKGLIRALAREKDMEIAGAFESGEDLEAFDPGRFDVVVMDIGLPGKSGIEISRKLKSISPELRILMYTVHKVEEEIFQAFRSGADGYCIKESRIESLLLGIRAVSLGSLYIDPTIAHLAIGRISRMQPREESPLSPRETEILKLLADGLTNREIALAKGISLSTVKAHIQNILEKLDAQSRADATAKGIRKGLI